MALSRTLIIILVAFSTIFSTIAVEEYIVGDDYGWRTLFDYQAWAADKNFYVGDRIELNMFIVFKYVPGWDNVVRVNPDEFITCSVSPNAITLSSGEDEIIFGGTGARWYISSIGNHCKLGQKLAIYVWPAWFPPLPSPAPWTPITPSADPPYTPPAPWTPITPSIVTPPAPLTPIMPPSEPPYAPSAPWTPITPSADPPYTPPAPWTPITPSIVTPPAPFTPIMPPSEPPYAPSAPWTPITPSVEPPYAPAPWTPITPSPEPPYAPWTPITPSTESPYAPQIIPTPIAQAPRTPGTPSSSISPAPAPSSQLHYASWTTSFSHFARSMPKKPFKISHSNLLGV
ncbi:vegetative cell wall protein gp1-like [Arachis stenosperma]|uniref:vegetative cell wall protein gp1-like n=1 Tax=Arachis stenosperma TaxID=217475 RepID=UPI0025ACAF23|nr:vegetative cell wall protein gp1-like [Arachis stenosperma]